MQTFGEAIRITQRDNEDFEKVNKEYYGVNKDCDGINKDFDGFNKDFNICDILSTNPY